MHTLTVCTQSTAFQLSVFPAVRIRSVRIVFFRLVRAPSATAWKVNQIGLGSNRFGDDSRSRSDYVLVVLGLLTSKHPTGTYQELPGSRKIGNNATEALFFYCKKHDWDLFENWWKSDSVRYFETDTYRANKYIAGHHYPHFRFPSNFLLVLGCLRLRIVYSIPN